MHFRSNTMNVPELFDDSEFLRAFRRDVPCRTRGCILMEEPHWLAGWLRANDAVDATQRDGLAERSRDAVAVLGDHRIAECTASTPGQGVVQHAL